MYSHWEEKIINHKPPSGVSILGKGLILLVAVALGLGVAVLSPAPGAAAEQEELQSFRETIEELEERVFELEAEQTGKPPARSFDALELNIGGFLTQSLSLAISEEGSDSTFDETNFELLISAKLSETTDFFAALGWLNFVKLDETDPERRKFAGRVQPRPAIILWAKQRFTESFQVKAGRYVTAWGIIHREHFPPTLLSQQQPQHLQPINGGLGGFRTIATFINGLEATGKFFFGGSNIEYSAYVGNYTGPAPFAEGEFVSGGLLGLGLMGDKIKVGINQQGGTKPLDLGSVDADGNTILEPGDYSAVGAYLRLSFGSFLLKSELFTNSVDGQDNDQSGIYIQPSLRFGGRHLVFYRIDQFDGNTEEDNVTADLTEVDQQIIGYNYLPVANIRLRAEYLINSFSENTTSAEGVEQERDYQMVKFSGVFSF